jgi:SAM-dependent methyltransferase
MRKAYADDLAYIHDAGFSDFVLKGAPSVSKILRQNHILKGLVIDLGCGSGIWARRLCDQGYDVLGIDTSPAMIRLAKKNAPHALFITGSFLRTTLPKCNAITAFGEVPNYAFDPRNNSRELSRFFRQAHEALRPGGLLILDIAGPGRGGPDGLRQGGSLGKDWAILFRLEEDRARHLLTRKIVTFRKVGKSYRRSEETHVLRLYPPTLVASMLQRAGFGVRAVSSYGQDKLPPGLTAFIARKPTNA